MCVGGGRSEVKEMDVERQRRQKLHEVEGEGEKTFEEGRVENGGVSNR